jgi:Flp pilus assembly protein TadG
MKLGYRPFPLRSAIAPLLRRLIKASDGIETIEFALVSITLFLFLFGVVEFGWLYWTQSELQYAAEAAARWCTINSAGANPCSTSTGLANAKAYAAGQVLGMSISSSNLTNFTVSAATCGNRVSFTYTYNFLVVGTLFPQNSVTLSATACHQA